MIIVAVLGLLAVLAVRAHAQPYDDDDLDDELEIRGRIGTTSRVVRTAAPPTGPSSSGRSDHPWAGSHSDLATDSRDELAVDMRGAPPIAAVLAAAYRTAGLADDPIPGWRRRSRLSALIPWITARTGQNESWREVVDPTVSRGIALDVRAAWHLDRLVFDSNEPRFEILDVARRRDRRRLAAVVIRRYFEWLAARTTVATVDTLELAAELDVLTDGWFSQATAKAAQP